MNTKRKRAYFALGGLVLLAGCGQPASTALNGEVNASSASMPQDAMDAPAEAAKRMANSPASAGGAKAEEGKETTAGLDLASMTQRDPQTYLIRNATLTLEAQDVRKTMNEIVNAARGVKGYVSDSHETTDGLGGISVALTVRIPYNQFDRSMQDIAALGKVLERQVTAQDVTEEFVDTQARTRNLKSAEARLLTHLSKTGKLSDTLLVEKEISRVRQEVEQLEGRLRYLANQVSYSTLTLTIKETPRPQAITPPETFSGGKVAADATRSLVTFLQSVWSAAIWLGVWAILWVPPVFLLWRWSRRLRFPNSPPTAPR